MSKPTQAPLELKASEREDLVAQAREYMTAAAVILKTLGPDLSRVGWMIEDSLVYLDQALSAEEEVFDDTLVSTESEEQPPEQAEAQASVR